MKINGKRTIALICAVTYGLHFGSLGLAEGEMTTEGELIPEIREEAAETAGSFTDGDSIVPDFAADETVLADAMSNADAIPGDVMPPVPAAIPEDAVLPMPEAEAMPDTDAIPGDVMPPVPVPMPEDAVLPMPEAEPAPGEAAAPIPEAEPAPEEEEPPIPVPVFVPAVSAERTLTTGEVWTGTLEAGKTRTAAITVWAGSYHVTARGNGLYVMIEKAETADGSADRRTADASGEVSFAWSAGEGNWLITVGSECGGDFELQVLTEKAWNELTEADAEAEASVDAEAETSVDAEAETKAEVDVETGAVPEGETAGETAPMADSPVAESADEAIPSGQDVTDVPAGENAEAIPSEVEATDGLTGEAAEETGSTVADETTGETAAETGETGKAAEVMPTEAAAPETDQADETEAEKAEGTEAVQETEEAKEETAEERTEERTEAEGPAPLTDEELMELGFQKATVIAENGTSVFTAAGDEVAVLPNGTMFMLLPVNDSLGRIRAFAEDGSAVTGFVQLDDAAIYVEVLPEEPVIRTIRLSSTMEGMTVVSAGTEIVLTAELGGFLEDDVYTVQWQYSEDGVTFTDVEGANELTHSYIVTRETFGYTWALVLTLQSRDAAVIEEAGEN